MTEKELQRHATRITGVLRAAYQNGGWTAVDDRTPAEVLMADEPEWDELEAGAREAYDFPSEEVPDLQLRALKMEEAQEVAEWARRRLVAWLLGGGSDPFPVVQRFYALAWGFYRGLLGPFTGKDIAEMLGQGKAAFSAVMKRLFAAESKRSLGKVVKVQGQKRAESAESYAANARKHKPRQMLEGELEDEEKAREAGLEAEAQRQLKERKGKLRQMREDAERRRLAAELGCRPEEIDLGKIDPVRD